MNHPLDNVIWRALSRTQAHLGQRNGHAARFLKDVSILGGMSSPSREGYESLAFLLDPGERVGLFLDEPPQPPGGCTVLSSIPMAEMVHCGDSVSEVDGAGFVQLREADVPEMLALTTLTKPGPFGPRTHEMGEYWGLRRDGNLIAMAGERLRVTGFTEISAVCTHPDYLGRSLATRLIVLLLQRIRDRGEQAFLHVRPENERAVRLYERLGFKARAWLHYAVLTRNN